MAYDLDYDSEIQQAERFRTLVSICERINSPELAVRFAILASLSEEKAKVLKELIDDASSDIPRGKVLEWPEPDKFPTTKVRDS